MTAVRAEIIMATRETQFDMATKVESTACHATASCIYRRYCRANCALY